MSKHPNAHQLVYAADMSFVKGLTIRQMIDLGKRELDRICKAFEGLGIAIKGNTLFRLLGALAFLQLEAEGCRIFGDYKLFDVKSTCDNDGSWLQNVPDLSILTVNIDVKPIVFTSLAEMLPNVIIAPVGPLTDLSDEDFERRGDVSRDNAVSSFFDLVSELPSKGVISSPKDLLLAPTNFSEGRTLITPAIRPLYTFVEGDTNALNALTPTKAIEGGSGVLVVGGPIRHNNELRSNAIRIMDEIGEAS